MKGIKGRKERKKQRKNSQALRYEIKLLSNKMSWFYGVSRSTRYPANLRHHVLASHFCWRFKGDTISESFVIRKQ
jgi:hypothetical protein